REETIFHLVSSLIRFRGSLAPPIPNLGLRPMLGASLRLRHHSACDAVNAVVSILTPGPWVVEMVTDLMYVPLAVAGLSFISISSNAERFDASCSGLNDALPIGVWMMPPFSTRNSTRPALSSRTALATSAVTVPTLGFGIRPRGPSTRPILPT